MELVGKDAVIYQLYKACLDGEISKSTFFKVKEICKRTIPVDEIIPEEIQESINGYKWISMNERKPKIQNGRCMSDVVVVITTTTNKMTAIYEISNGKSCFWSFQSGDDIPNVTHWMPLPKDPKKD